MTLPVIILLFAALLIYAGVHNMSVTDVLNGALNRKPSGSGLGSLFPQAIANGANAVAGAVGNAASAVNSAIPGAGGSAKRPISGSGVNWTRTDMGVDAGAPKGTPVIAMRSGVVSHIIPDWYAGQPWLAIDSPGLPGGATGIYYAEGWTPNVHVGQRVTAGQVIGHTTGNSLEFGFSRGGDTLAKATTGYTEGQVTVAGQLFHSFLGL